MTEPLVIEFGKDWEATMGKLREPEKVLEQPMKRFLTRAILFAERKAREGAPYDTGALARSLVSEVHPMSARVFSTRNYAMTMEVGMKPWGEMPNVRPDPDSLVGWIRRHGLSMSPFALANAIAKRGIRGRFFMRKTKLETEAQMPAFLAELGGDIGKEWLA